MRKILSTGSFKKIYQSSLFLTILFFISGFIITGCAKPVRPPEPPQPDKILRVGDKLLPFTLNDVLYGVVDSNGLTWIKGKEYTDSAVYGPGVIKLREKGAWVELKNGIRYTCLTEGGCRISWKDYTIIQGEIRVSYKK